MAALSWKYYIVFCVLNAVLFVLVWGLFPETKGRSLEEVGRVFEKENEKVINVFPDYEEKGKEIYVEEVA